ncbi:FAD:protein FMN transferase [Paenibacillus ferrarius]|uniref:FAD:protein FMN transferase n=1 Tax=Paenibacillus ferrarius TaxID=1469647 RepID=UPI003D2C663B
MASPQAYLPFHFHTMASDIELLLYCSEEDQSRIHHAGTDWFRRVDQRFNSELADSEINLLNTLAGESCLVSNQMLEVLFLAEMYHAVTDGNYSPLYMQSPQFVPTGREWVVDPAHKTVTLPLHTHIDLQGLEVSWAIKRLAAYIRKTLAFDRGRLASRGELTVWGSPAQDEQPWVIGLHNPWDDHRQLGCISIKEGALSTCSPMELRGNPRSHSILQCTVSGPDIVECQVWARLLCALEPQAGLPLFAKRSTDCEALIVTKDQELHYYGQEASLNTKWHDLSLDHAHFHKPWQ